MPITLKTKLIRLCEPHEPLTGAAGQLLTQKRFVLRNGLWIQSHVFEPIELASLYDLPEPGEHVRRSARNASSPDSPTHEGADPLGGGVPAAPC